MSDSIEPESTVEPVFKAIVVNSIGPHKIKFITLLRASTPIGLKEAKEMSELSKPFVLAVCAEEDAVRFQSLVAEMGGECELADYDEQTVPAIANEAPFQVAESRPKSGCVTSAAIFLALTAGLVYAIVSVARAAS